MTTLDLLKRSKPDCPGGAHRLGAHPPRPVPVGVGLNAQRYDPEAERALHETRQGYYLDAQKQTARRIAKAAAGR